MSPLERRCRLLLRAYPASYRRARGEEILGTLLETTPGSRKLPLARDIWALVTGGLRARAAQNRGLSLAANLRLVALLGIAIYLGVAAAGYLEIYLAVKTGGRWVPTYPPSSWPALLAALLIMAAVVLLWVRRRPVFIGGALAAAAATVYGGFSQLESTVAIGTQLLCLAVLVLLTGRTDRLSWGWLWLTGGIVAAVTLPSFLQVVAYGPVVTPSLLLGILVLLIAWIGIDARPAAALGAYLLLVTLSALTGNIVMGLGNWFADPAVLVAGGIAALAVWKMRRQSVQ